MKINQWLGYNEESSQYLLRRGELRSLVNLQPRRPGMLMSRAGMTKIYGSYGEELIRGLYRKDTPYGKPDIFLLLQKAEVDRPLTQAQQEAGESPLHLVWLVTRLTMGYPLELRSIAQIPLSPNGLTYLQNMAVAEDRHGRMFMFFGHGAKPLMYRPASIENVALELGLSAPLQQPLVTTKGEGYFLERVDILDGGGSYWGPPTITVEGGNPDRIAKVKAIVQAGNVVGVEVIDGGANYKSTPRLTVGNDRMGVGFRGVGIRELDPGVQGFLDTAAGVVSNTGNLSDTDTYAAKPDLATPKILYVSSPYAATATTTPSAGTATSTMVLDTVSNVQIGDFVTVRGATTPTAFNSANSLIRVIAVNASTKTITLSRQWTPTANATYQVMFQRNTTLAEAPATYNSATNTFEASIPLRTLRGVGRNAEATIKISPAGKGYSLGQLSRSGFTVPTGGSSQGRYGYQLTGWDTYALKGPYYWNSDPQEQPKAANAAVYAGLQASGETIVAGYAGPVRGAQKLRQSTDRRADVYWPDYSKISVWFWAGARRTGQANWVRRDVVVQGNTGSSPQPYVLVTLEPAAKETKIVTGKGGRKKVVYVSTTPQGTRPPVVKINLQTCPQEWVTNDPSGFNLPTSVKEANTNRLQWWNSSAKTPRPIVDFRGSAEGVTLDAGTVEVVDEGDGWEEGTEFLLRIYQANPYAQQIDYNFATRPARRPGSHARLNNQSRFVTLAFRASKPSVGAAFGPPTQLNGDQYVDVGGFDYRLDDVGCVTLARRSQFSSGQTKIASFKGYVSASGQLDEFIYESPTLLAAYSVSGTTATITYANHGLTVGDKVTLTFTSGAGASSNYVVATVPSPNVFTVVHRSTLLSSGNVTVTPTNRQRSAATITRISGDVLSSAMYTRDVLECRQANVLFPFNQLLTINTSAGTVGLDKMAYPRASLLTTSNATFASTSRLRWASPVPDYVIVGQQLQETATTYMSSQTFTITAIEDEPSGARVATVDATISGIATVTVRPIFDFDVYTGIREAQTIRWTAGTVASGDGSYKITGVKVVSRGRNYHGSPTLLSRGGGTGYGLTARGNVENGQITSVDILDSGQKYTADPELYTPTQPASIVPVMRPSLRGTYRCAYRFADRSETVVAKGTVFVLRGERPQIIQLQEDVTTLNLKNGMIVEGDLIPWGARLVSITPSNNGLELSIPLTCRGRLQNGTVSITISSPGEGYGATEAITCTPPAGTTGYTFTVNKRINEKGTYSVESVTVANAANGSLLDVGEIPLTFSPPAAGGATASGYAGIRFPDTAANATITFRDMSKPIAYSDFSAIVDVDAGPNEFRENSSEIEWAVPGITVPPRADLVEFYRTSSDQSLVFYRLEMYGIPSAEGIQIIGKDTLTDEELFDPDRPFYGAVPVVLPNGNLNAYRFGQPRTDMAVCVAFQDRLWYGVSTSGQDANTLFYSEFDEFESCPDTYELPIQNNQRTTDSLTALVPFGSLLLAMQHTHCYAVQYNTDPAVDVSIQMVAHRGCLSQRCWDIHDNMLYAADETGIYSLSRSGEVTALSDPIREWFNSELIDLSNRDTFFLNVDGRSRTLRFFCSAASQPTATPSFAMCFHLDMKGWWIERYPNSLCSAVAGRPQSKRSNCSVYGGVDGNLYELNGLTDTAYQTLVSVTVTDGGRGYREPPTITVPQGEGVQLQGIVSEGRLVDVLIPATGWDVWWGVKLLTHDNLQLLTEDGVMLDTQEPWPMPLTISPPLPGGSQAVAEAVFSMNNRVVRRCQVRPHPTTGLPFENRLVLLDVVEEYRDTSPINTLEGDALTTQDGAPMRIEGTAIEPGMEVFSEVLPPGVIVDRLDGADVVLAYPDGSFVKAYRATPTGDSVTVAFVKKYQSHIPFHMGTGYMELISENNVQRRGDTQISRSISVLYTPTDKDKTIELIEYYNGSVYPRANVMRRDRGGSGGFVHRDDSASTVLNIGKAASHLGAATGVARATFAARTNVDATGGDQHLRVDLLGRIAPANVPTDPVPQSVVLHSLTIDGVVENAE